MSQNFAWVAFTVFLALHFFSAGLYAQSDAAYKKYAGDYITGHEWGGGLIRLEADGTFSQEGGSDDGTTLSSSGKYILSNGELIFSITRWIGTRSSGKQYNLLDPKDVNEWSYGHESELQKEFKLLFVQWSDRIYLIYQDELRNFANAINLGIEPRSTLRSFDPCSPWYGSFYLRRGDEKKKVVGFPDLPKEWRAFLLNNPLSLKVVSVQEIRKRSEYLTEFTFTVNQGSKRGLRMGMLLLTRNGNLSPSNGADVISVDGARASVKITLSGTQKIKVGDKLTTRYVPKDSQLCKWLEKKESIRESQ